MISSKKLMQMAKRWTKAEGVTKRTKISAGDASMADAQANTVKGHFAVYTNDGKRFVVPLKWLASDVFGEMLEMAEEEFGLPHDGPITLPIDAFSMEEVVGLMKGRNVLKAGSGYIAASGGRYSDGRWSARQQQKQPVY